MLVEVAAVVTLDSSAPGPRDRSLVEVAAVVRLDSSALGPRDVSLVEVATVGAIAPGTTPASKDIEGVGAEMMLDVG